MKQGTPPLQETATALPQLKEVNVKKLLGGRRLPLTRWLKTSAAKKVYGLAAFLSLFAFLKGGAAVGGIVFLAVVYGGYKFSSPPITAISQETAFRKGEKDKEALWKFENLWG